MRTMKAVTRARYGGPEVLALDEVPVPEPRDDQVLVHVRATSLDRGAWHLMTGLPRVVRPVYGVRRPRSATFGTDLAGVVEAVGAKVSAFRPGDEVFGTSGGSFAEYTVARPRTLAPKPTQLGFEQAAALPVSGLTALQALRDKAPVRPGQHVLVIGASGGVGTFAVQMAKASGAEVTGVCSAAKADLVRSIGADHVIEHDRHEITRDGRRYDVVLDIAGNRPLGLLRRVLAPTGRLLIIGAEDAGDWFGMGRQLRATAMSPFVRQRLGTFVSVVRHDDLLALRDLADEGRLVPVVDRTCALVDLPEAMRDLEAGRVRGKIVLIP